MFCLPSPFHLRRLFLNAASWKRLPLHCQIVTHASGRRPKKRDALQDSASYFGPAAVLLVIFKCELIAHPPEKQDFITVQISIPMPIASLKSSILNKGNCPKPPVSCFSTVAMSIPVAEHKTKMGSQAHNHSPHSFIRKQPGQFNFVGLDSSDQH